MPPMKKQIVANNEGHCKAARPMIPCPDVQPLAYLVPNPTIKPPTTIKRKPLMESNIFQLNSSLGSNPTEVFYSLIMKKPGCIRRDSDRIGISE